MNREDSRLLRIEEVRRSKNCPSRSIQIGRETSGTGENPSRDREKTESEANLELI